MAALVFGWLPSNGAAAGESSCERHGRSFIRIANSQACLSFGGDVWAQYGANAYRDARDTPGYVGGSYFPGGATRLGRARLFFDSRAVSDWGDVRLFIRLESYWRDAGPGALRADQALIEIGPLVAGYTESFWLDSKNGLSTNYGSHSWGGMHYGYQQRHLFGYRFGGWRGLFAAVAFEGDPAGPMLVPDIVSKAGFASDRGALWVTAARDAVDRADGSVLALAAGAALHINDLSGRVIGYYSTGDGDYGAGSPLGQDAEFSVLGSLEWRMSPAFSASIAAQIFRNIYAANSSTGTGLGGYALELSTVWAPMAELELRSELHYDKVDGLNGTASGYVRVTRFF